MFEVKNGPTNDANMNKKRQGKELWGRRVVSMREWCPEGAGFLSCPPLQDNSFQSSPRGLRLPTCCPEKFT